MRQPNPYGSEIPEPKAGQEIGRTIVEPRQPQIWLEAAPSTISIGLVALSLVGVLLAFLLFIVGMVTGNLK